MQSKHIRSPCLVETLKNINITQVDCGANFTVAMTIIVKENDQKKGILFAWGDNQFSQLGLTRSEEPKPATKSKKPSMSELIRN